MPVTRRSCQPRSRRGGSRQGPAVGIDLGTTNSAVAYVNSAGRPEVIVNSDNDRITPSVIYFGVDETLVGNDAHEMLIGGFPNVAAFFKRQMGEEGFSLFLNGRDYTPVDLSAILLRKLKDDASETLGVEVTDAVITVPAYFRDNERTATVEAGERAGLNVAQVINEPTAAAMAYGLSRERNGQTTLVYDLGGGTFDVTLMQLNQDGIYVLSSEGNHELGGKDWDDQILTFACDAFEAEFSDNPAEVGDSISEIRARCEDVKKRLSSAATANISIVHGGNRGTYKLTREHFEKMTEHLVDQTMMLTNRVLDQLEIEPGQLAGILPVGGSTRMPMIADRLQNEFGVPVLGGVNPDEAVALGAALKAAQIFDTLDSSSSSGLKVGTFDVTNHSLGMIAENEDRSRFVNSIILPKNRTIPCDETQSYRIATRAGAENEMEIYMTQSESPDPIEATFLGRYVLSDIPHQASGVATVDVTFSYDESNIVEVSATLAEDSTAIACRVDVLPEDVPDRFLLAPAASAVFEPASVYLVFDLSGSMSGEPLELAKKAAYELLEKLDSNQFEVGIMAVADETSVAQRATSDLKSVRAAIESLSIGQVGIGNSADPFLEIQQELSNREGKRFAVVLADGVWSAQTLAIERAKTCHACGVDIVAIGFGGADEAFLRAIASSDEGSIFTDLGSLSDAFSTIGQIISERAGGITAAPQSPNTPSNKTSSLSLRNWFRGN